MLWRGKFSDSLAQADRTAQALVDDLRKFAFVVAPTNVPRVVPTDPDDDHVLAAALRGAADLIASGDQGDLLPLGSYAGIAFVSAGQAQVQRAVASIGRSLVV